jgi:ribulose-5-phosphate 4-epimerase/fuculose-1-phosphate aldolase
MTLTVEQAPPQTVEQVKDDLATAFRIAAMHGFNEGIDNHFSAAYPGRDDLFFLNRYGPHWSEITPDDIITVDFNGNVVEGEGDWDITAFMIHRGCHRAHPRARVVFHTHQPYATALSMTRGGFDTRGSQNATHFHERVGRLPYGGLAGGEEEGNRIGGAVADGLIAMILDNHGVMVMGNTVAEAWFRLYFFERAAQVQLLAQSTGDELIRMPEQTAREARAFFDSETHLPDALFAAERRRVNRLPR